MPCSAAYSRAVTACAGLPARSAAVPERSASIGVAACGVAASCGMAPSGRGTPATDAAGATVLGATARCSPSDWRLGPEGTGAASLGRPSKLAAGEKPSASPISPILRTALYVRITRLLGRAARVRDRAVACRSHLLGVFPYVP